MRGPAGYSCVLKRHSALRLAVSLHPRHTSAPTARWPASSVPPGSTRPARATAPPSTASAPLLLDASQLRLAHSPPKARNTELSRHLVNQAVRHGYDKQRQGR